MPDPAVADTVILRYFLFVDRADLMLDLLGRPLYVPPIVFDPDEGTPEREEAMSEITRSILVQRRTADDPGRPARDREEARRKAEALTQVRELHASGAISVVGLNDAELETFARLTSASGAREAGLAFRLDAGEAACVALAVHRTWVFATDDQDVLTALEKLSPSHPYERIRKLLKRAADEGRISQAEANAIHAEMTQLGFRDVVPFPVLG